MEDIRKFHSNAKKSLYEEMYTRIPYRIPTCKARLLDLSCGRCGDLHKWYAVGYKHVVGIDVHERSLSEAQSRIQSKKKKTLNEFNVDLVHEDLLDADFVSSFAETNFEKFDTVSMNFALHYFFKDLDCVDHLMAMISKVLRPGGFFFGIDLDGNRIRNVVDEKIHEHESNDKYVLTPYFEDNSYSFCLTEDHGSNYFQFMKTSSMEYLVDVDKLVELCEKNSLILERIEHLTEDKMNHVIYFDVVFVFKKPM